MIAMQVIYIDKEELARRTGVGAALETDRETIAAFYSIPAGCAETSPFIIDLVDDDGDIIDNRSVSAETFRAVTGEPILSDAEYVAYDGYFNAGTA